MKQFLSIEKLDTYILYALHESLHQASLCSCLPLA